MLLRTNHIFGSHETVSWQIRYVLAYNKAQFGKWTKSSAGFVRQMMMVVVVYSGDDLIHNTYGHVSDSLPNNSCCYIFVTQLCYNLSGKEGL
jgi:hypothetical protein